MTIENKTVTNTAVTRKDDDEAEEERANLTNPWGALFFFFLKALRAVLHSPKKLL